MGTDPVGSTGATPAVGHPPIRVCSLTAVASLFIPSGEDEARYSVNPCRHRGASRRGAPRTS